MRDLQRQYGKFNRHSNRDSLLESPLSCVKGEYVPVVVSGRFVQIPESNW